MSRPLIPPQLRAEISAYERLLPELQAHHAGKFVVIHAGQLQGAYDTFDAAGREAIRRFGDGPYLIRQVGVPLSMPMPASVAYRLCGQVTLASPLIPT